MNKFEGSTTRERRASVRSSTNLWSAALALLVVVLLMLGLSTGDPKDFYVKMAIGAAVLMLVVRQVTRRAKVKRPKASEPDPQSALKLD